jgi:hypothetical protein
MKRSKEMENKLRIPAMATAVCIVAFAVWPHCAAVANVGARSAARSSTLGHLFVLDVQQRAVFRYRLAQDGLPAIKPDGVLYPEGTVYPEGLAVDKAGHIYVADPHGWGCDYIGVCLPAGGVAEYAADATGPQHPISILRLSQNNPDRLKIDDSGRLYVHYNAGQDIAIFAKGAHGNDSPISVIPPFYDPELASDYVIAKNGALYVLDSPGPIMLYDDPLQSPSQPNQLMWPDGGYEFAFSQTLALDEADKQLYSSVATSTFTSWGHPKLYHQSGAFLVS